jgi:hypothetical protein
MMTIQIDMQCDVCGKGKMIPTGQAFLTHPPQFPHECDECHVRVTYGQRYPHIKHVPIVDNNTDVV